MPALDRFRGGAAAHAHREIGETASPRSVLAEGGEGVTRALCKLVMPGLVPGIHVFTVALQNKTWMAGSSPAMTRKRNGRRPSPTTSPNLHPLALRRWHQRPAHACTRGRLRDAGPAVPLVAARLPRACL